VTAAERVAWFRLCAVDTDDGTRTTRRRVEANELRFVSVLAAELQTAGIDPAYAAKGWRLSAAEAAQDAPQCLVFRDADAPAGGPRQVIRETVVSGEFVREVGRLFAPARAESSHAA
jgi:hypothetical protein